MDVSRIVAAPTTPEADTWMSNLGRDLDVFGSAFASADTFEHAHEQVSVTEAPQPPREFVPASNDGKGMVLPPEQLAAYCDLTARMVQTAQLGEEFVDGKWAAAQLRALKHVDSLGTPLQLAISDDTGLPMRTAWMAVQAARKQAEDNDAFRRTTGKKVWQHLVDVPGRTLDTVKIEVLDVDTIAGSRRFRVSHDAFVDPGYLMRTTMVVEQPKGTGRDGSLPLQNLTGTQWTLHPELMSTLQSSSAVQLSAGATTALARWGRHCVEFTRGIVGPFYFAGVAQPGDVAEVLDHYPGQAIGCFRSYRISRNPGTDDTASYFPWHDAQDPLLASLEKAGFVAKVRELWVAPPEVAPELELRARLGERPLTIRQMY